MAAIDRKPERPHPIAASTIRDLYDIAKAQENLLLEARDALCVIDNKYVRQLIEKIDGLTNRLTNPDRVS